MDLLKNKVCLITGTNRGIGAALLESFSRERAIVYANARQEGSIDEQVQGLKKTYGAAVVPVYFDIRDTTSLKNVMLKIQKEQGRLDVLVNNAGIMKDALIGMASKELMRDIFETNVFASMELLQYAARIMKKNNSGSIINFSSIVGVQGNKGQIVYSASKGAVISMTKTASKELAPYHIRVNAVAPGMIDTDMFHSIGEVHIQEHLDRIGMGRLGTPGEVADACVMLASDYARYITGQIIGVDGAAVV
ncbi:MAG: SDR family oxidoreductase [Lachnospiraceae bacterium]|nr:SDR family oxidoreductase [Lachnospiraceae bacterium]